MMPTVPQHQVILIAPPDNLLLERPVSRVVSTAPEEIAKGYVKNTLQLGIANRQLKALREWKVKQLQIQGEENGTDRREELLKLH